ncbi:MAG: ferredoxin-nitrite reductase, partial [Natronomonas sp.]
GGLGENPQFADWVEMRVAADEVPGYIRNLLRIYDERAVRDEQSERDDGLGDRESFREFIARHDEDELTGLAEPEETSYEDPYLNNTKMTWYPYAEDDEMDASPAPSPADD